MEKTQKIQLWACKGVERILIEEYQKEFIDYISNIELPRISQFEPLSKDTWLELTFEDPKELKTEETD